MSDAATRRDLLPGRRPSEQIEFTYDDQPCVATIGYYDRDKTRIGEIFLNVGKKADSGIDIAARDMAISASIAIQHGCTIDVLRHALTRSSRGDPQSALGTLLDLLAKE